MLVWNKIQVYPSIRITKGVRNKCNVSYDLTMNYGESIFDPCQLRKSHKL